MQSKLFWAGALVCLATSLGLGQDPVKVEPKHYTRNFENERVDVVSVHYGPHEKSAMHQHEGNPAVIVALKAGGRMHFVYPDGSTSEGRPENAGAVRFVPARPPLDGATHAEYAKRT